MPFEHVRGRWPHLSKVFYEIFASPTDFEAHNAMPYVPARFARLPKLAIGGVLIMRMEILGQRRE